MSRNSDVPELLQGIFPPCIFLLPQPGGGRTAGGETAEVEISGEQGGGRGLGCGIDGGSA